MSVLMFLCGCCPFLQIMVASSVVTVRVSTVLTVFVSEPPGVLHSSTVLTVCVSTVLCFFCFTVFPGMLPWLLLSWLLWLLSWPFIVEGLSSPGVCRSGDVCRVECEDVCRVECEDLCRRSMSICIYASSFSELACEMVASFPGSCMGGEKRAWYTLFAHAQFSQDFWEFGNSCKICSVNTCTPTSPA